MTRTSLTESGSYRTEQLFTKSLIDHLHRNRLEPKQAQFIVNKLAQLIHIYDSKIAKSFEHLNINSATFVENITKADRLCEPLVEDHFKGGQRLFAMYFNSCLEVKSKGYNKNVIALITFTCLFSVILSLILSVIPVVKAMDANDQPIQIKSVILHEQYRINVVNNYPRGTVKRLKQTTVKWALQEFISLAAGRIEMDIAKHQVSFCAKEEIETKYIVSRLKVGPVQSSIIFRNNSNYYQSCFSFFSFQHEEMFDKAIIYNLHKFTQKFNDRNFINSKMLL